MRGLALMDDSRAPLAVAEDNLVPDLVQVIVAHHARQPLGDKVRFMG